MEARPCRCLQRSGGLEAGAVDAASDPDRDGEADRCGRLRGEALGTQATDSSDSRAEEPRELDRTARLLSQPGAVLEPPIEDRKTPPL